MEQCKRLGAAALVAAAAVTLAPNANGANADTVAVFTQYVNEIAAKYGGPPAPVVADVPLGDGVNALSHDQQIQLSTTISNMTPAEANAYMASSYDGSWHAAGCEPLRGLAIHEYAHHWEVAKGRAPFEKLLDAAETGTIPADKLLSDLHPAAYRPDGKINQGEGLAVAFQAVECGSSSPTEQLLHGFVVN